MSLKSELKDLFSGFTPSKRAYRTLAFLIPFAVFALIYISMSVWPFGNGTVLVLDLNGQYVYFFEGLRDALIGKASFFYSFRRALSGEFLGILAYYLASPLSLLVLLFPKGNIQEAILLILLCKCGLCGLTSYYYIEKTRNILGARALIFSSAYALCSYGIIYASNTMWIDCMYLLPLILLGMTRLICEKKHLLYTLSLAAALITSYYIGYMICIFAVLFFFAYYFSRTPEERGSTLERHHFIKTSLRFSLFSLISAALASPMLLSAAYSLGFGKSDFSTPKYAFSVKTAFADVFLKMLPVSYDTVRPEGMPLVYCSTLCLILGILYFISPAIRPRRKAALGALLAILTVSFCGSTIDLVWHGFQFPNWMNFRYSFMFVFILILAACDIFCADNGFELKSAIAVGMCVMAGAALLQKFEYDTFDPSICVWSAMGGVILTLIGLRVSRSSLRGKTVILLALTLLELYANGIASDGLMNEDVGFSNHASYANFMKKYGAASDYIHSTDPGLYRSESYVFRKVNDNFALRLNGVSGSTSTLNAKVIDFLEDVGYSSRSHHSNYVGGNVVNDSLLGIKYVVSNVDKVPDPSYTLEWTDSNGEAAVFKNPYALPIAYLTDTELIDFDTSAADNPFEVLNRMTGAMLGKARTDIFLSNNKCDITAENAERTSNASIKTYTKKKASLSARLNFVVTAQHDGVLYGYFPVTNGYRRDITIKFGETELKKYFTSDNHGIFCLGEHKAGDTVYVTMALEEEKVNFNSSVYFYTLNEDAFEQTMRILEQSGAELDEKHTDAHFNGRLKVSDNKNLLLLTMPYDKNITVTANGKKCETLEVAGIFTGVVLGAGEYEFTVKYLPKEFIGGSFIALFGLCVLLLYTLFSQRKRNSADKKACDMCADDADNEHGYDADR